jgi:hypothetical protein
MAEELLQDRRSGERTRRTLGYDETGLKDGVAAHGPRARRALNELVITSIQGTTAPARLRRVERAVAALLAPEVPPESTK